MSELHLSPLDANEMQVNESGTKALISITNKKTEFGWNYEIRVKHKDFSRHLEFQSKAFVGLLLECLHQLPGLFNCNAFKIVRLSGRLNLLNVLDLVFLIAFLKFLLKSEITNIFKATDYCGHESRMKRSLANVFFYGNMRWNGLWRTCLNFWQKCCQWGGRFIV